MPRNSCQVSTHSSKKMGNGKEMLHRPFLHRTSSFKIFSCLVHLASFFCTLLPFTHCFYPAIYPASWVLFPVLWHIFLTGWEISTVPLYNLQNKAMNKFLLQWENRECNGKEKTSERWCWKGHTWIVKNPGFSWQCFN